MLEPQRGVDVQVV